MLRPFSWSPHSLISVGNPRDQLTQNADFIAILAPLKVRLFKISPVIPNGIYSNKVYWRAQIELFLAYSRSLILENIRRKFFLRIWASEIMSTNLDENRLLHQFYWDLSDFLPSNMSKDLFRNKIGQSLFCKWAPSSEFVSSSIPSWQILTAHAQPFRGARDLAFCLKVPLDSLLVWASSEGSGETARMRRLAWTFAARIGDKYQILFTRSKCPVLILCNLS